MLRKWRLVDTKVLCSSDFLSVFDDLVILPNGQQILFTKVEFRDYIPHNQIQDAYRSSDVFVLPSLNEGMSNAVLEAMAAGLPIITTDTGGSVELIKGNGFIVEKKDTQSIVRAIQAFLNSRELIVEMGQHSRKIAENLGWNNIARAYYDLYSMTS